MSCLSTTRRAELEAERDTLIAQLTVLNTAITSAMTTGHIQSYSLDTGEGKQTTKYRSIDEMFKARDLIQSQIDTINRKLRGTGLVNINLRR